MTKVKANTRTFAIGFYLLSGWLVWGVDFTRADPDPPRLPLCEGFGRDPAAFILCCGHKMRPAEVGRWKAAGLMIDGGDDAQGRPTVVAGPALEAWVSAAWHNLRARTWGNA